MPWPYDERHFNFAPGMAIPSQTLNDIQDKLIGLHAEKHKWLSSMYTYSQGWQLTNSGWWEAANKAPLFIYPDLPSRTRVTRAVFKFFYTGIVTSSSDLKLELYEYNPQLTNPASAPTMKQFAFEVVQGNEGWRIKEFALNALITDDKQLVIKVWDGSPGEKLAAVKITYLPVTDW